MLTPEEGRNVSVCRPRRALRLKSGLGAQSEWSGTGQARPSKGICILLKVHVAGVFQAQEEMTCYFIKFLSGVCRSRGHRRSWETSWEGSSQLAGASEVWMPPHPYSQK